MPKYLKDTENVNIPPHLGRWVWKNDSKKLELISSHPGEEGVLRTSHTINNFKELQQRAEWLAEIFTVNHRGRQSMSSLSPAHFYAYRSSVLKRPGDRVTIEDVKRRCQDDVELMTVKQVSVTVLQICCGTQIGMNLVIKKLEQEKNVILEPHFQQLEVAVGLLQENYLLPVPHRFLDLLKSEELDEVLATLLLYLSWFFEHKSLENKPTPLVVVSECRMMAETLAKKEMAQKKLAVCFFRLMMDLERDQHHPYHKSQMSSNRTEWLLHACIYSFFCYVAWVTFGRKDLKDIQEEVGRLLYSDAFNMAVKNMTDGNSKMTSAVGNGSVKTGAADYKITTCNSELKPRTPQRRLPLSSIVNQRSPLMVSLLPSPKERSPHLFLGSRARSQSPLKAEYCDTKALMEQLDQQVASVSFGILGKPLAQFSHSTLLPYGEQKSRDEGEDEEAGSDVNNSADHPGIHVQGTELSFVGMKSTALSKYGSTALIKTTNCDLAH